MFTQVGKYKVPVKSAAIPSVVYFKSGAHGKKERGVYLFWTACFKRAVKSIVNGKQRRALFGRSLALLPPGDRFDRMRIERINAKEREDRKAYGAFWNDYLGRGKNIAYIRPSTKAEIARWIKTHESDARHISARIVGGKLWASR